MTNAIKIKQFKFPRWVCLLSALMFGVLLINYNLAPAHAAADTTIYFSPASSTVNANQSFSSNVVINPSTNLVTAVELHLVFDQTKLHIASMTPNASLAVLTAAQFSNVSGTASLIVGVPAASPVVPVTSITSVANIVFQTIGGAGTTSTVNFDIATVAAAQGESGNIISSRTGETLTINGTAPVLSGGGPTGNLVSGTSQTTLVVTTSESSTCKYATSPGVSYANMPTTFTTTGGTSHAATVSDLSDSSTYNYYVRCAGNFSNQNVADYPITFSVADNVAPVLSVVTPIATTTNSVTPSYTFNSSEAGVISYSGDCSSTASAASVGNNTVTFRTLSAGYHSNCTITVTDVWNNSSLPLSVAPFTIDTSVPVRGTPIQTLPKGTTSTALTLTTNKNSTCKYSALDVGYSSMTSTYSTTGGLSHSTTVTGFSDGNTYTFYSRCLDQAGNVNQEPYQMSFLISTTSVEISATVVSSSGGGGGGSWVIYPSFPVVSAASTTGVNVASAGSSSVPGQLSVQPSPNYACYIANNIKPGVTATDVKKLQQFLNRNGYPVASSGPGSAGHESTYFGTATKAAIKKFQQDHLSWFNAGFVPNGELSATTRDLVNSLGGCFAPVKTAVSPITIITFTRNLKVGDIGADVKRLQQFLNSNGYIVSTSGPGSIGQETTKYGTFTKNVLKKYQSDHVDIKTKPDGTLNTATRLFINNILSK